MEESITVIKSVSSGVRDKFDIDVQTELGSEDELIILLALLLEKMTGVSTDTYLDAVDALREQS